jgi:hypothetical protein
VYKEETNNFPLTFTPKGGRPMRKTAYLSMDVHARNSVLGDMDGDGKFLGNLKPKTFENPKLHGGIA